VESYSSPSLERLSFYSFFHVRNYEKEPTISLNVANSKN
jgi:hypothetical protein